ncbi:MAG: ATP-binding protein [Halanaerobiales bacterium]|nr:ATP-binding protein [Halanaerobiales bacterium]
MLLEFSVANFLSFKDPVTFSMIASNKKEYTDTHTFKFNDKISLLKSSVLYGANASGKSNLFAAMFAMKDLIKNSAKNMMAEESIGVEPFRLNTSTVNEPSSFEIIFIYKNIKYRYGFQVTTSEVVSEWLFYTPNIREVKLFEREKTEYSITKHFKESIGLEEKTRNNALFISVVAQFNGEISNKILNWFNRFNIINNNDKNNQRITNLLLKSNEKMKKTILQCLQIADLRIDNVEIVDNDIPSEVVNTFELFKENNKKVHFEFPTNVTDVNFFYKKYNEYGEFVSHEKFDLDVNESKGTKILYSLLGPILDTLLSGKVLLIDELDSSLHPLLIFFIIKLFQSKSNSKNAQLIFTTHDTNILSNKVFRRDQIWFTEKDHFGATDLYSLVEYKIRKDATFNKDYLLGKYGAIPFIGNFDFVLDEIEASEQNGE